MAATGRSFIPRVISMIKNQRRKVLAFESRLLLPSNQEAFTAVLECGHRLNLGVSQHRPNVMACYECGPKKSTSVNVPTEHDSTFRATRDE